ncbi:MAG: SelB C-terminal domain-containing protein [Candidatus Aminicenantales bacterium]|jgi:selenocysteine-specific elongation factor
MKKKIGGDEDRLLELAREKGLSGVRESEAMEGLTLDRPGLLALVQKLEEESRLRILAFSPLVLVSRDSLDFLGGKLLSFIAQFHEKNPEDGGLTLDRLKRRFDAPAKVLLLVLKGLVHEGAIRQEGRLFARAGFARRLPPREEKALRELEEACFQGGFRPVTVEDIQAQIPATPQKIGKMLDVLIERKKVVPNKDGFFLPARALDELIAKVRGLGKNEMSVADFKGLTGLSRKFAIPLLELLDDLSVTRRDGLTRKIL